MKSKSRQRLTSLAVAASCSLPLAGLASHPIEGFGAGAAGGTTPCVVRSLADSGPGTLRDCLSASGRHVTFSVGGTIRPTARYRIPSRTTLDGGTAPAPGVTVDGSLIPPGEDVFRIYAGAGQVTSDIIVRDIRVAGAPQSNNDLFSLWGSSGGQVRRVAIDHVSLRDASDGNIDFAGDVQDVTVQWSIIGFTPAVVQDTGNSRKNNLLATLPGPARVSLHHNLYINGKQRSPQADYTAVLDVRNNVVRHWDSYGARFRDGTTANFVNNDYYTKHASRGQKALVVVPLNESSSSGDAGPIWVRGNLIPQQAGHESLGLATEEYAAAPVTTDPADGLEARVLASVGPSRRDAADAALIDAARVHSTGSGPTDVGNLRRTDRKP